MWTQITFQSDAFLTDEEDKAENLRKNSSKLPSGIDLYSASIDIVQLDSIFTTEHVVDLNNAMVSRYLVSAVCTYWEMFRMRLGVVYALMWACVRHRPYTTTS